MESTKYAFTSAEMQKLIGGHWYHRETGKAEAVEASEAVEETGASENTRATGQYEPELFYIDYFVTGTGLVEKPRTCFIAWDEETWLKGSGNSGHYAALAQDTHAVLASHYDRPRIKNNLCCVIAQRPIEKLAGIIPQLIVDNSYDCINILATAARAKAADNCKIIAVTGAVGKSTTTAMIHCLLEHESDCIANLNGHNSRTGVPMYLTAVGRFDPRFRKEGDKPNVCILEVAGSSLWKSSGSISRIVRPHIGIITYIQLTQYQQGSRTIKDVVNFKSKICDGITAGGYALVYRQTPEYEAVIRKVTEYGAKPVSYGFTPDCDSYIGEYDFPVPEAGKDFNPVSSIKATVLGESISYTVNGIGKPIVSNSLAALTAAKLAGFDISQVSKHLQNFHTKENVLQVSNIQGVCLIDDSHNFEVASLEAGLDLQKQIKQPPGGRKIVLMSRIVNMGEKTRELHRDMLKGPLTRSAADIFFFHDPKAEMPLLIPELPAEIVGGVYRTAREAASAVVRFVEQGDSVLLKGCPRGIDFGDILGLLTEGINGKFAEPSGAAATTVDADFADSAAATIDADSADSAAATIDADSSDSAASADPATTPDPAATPTPTPAPPPACVLAFSADRNRIVYQKGDPSAQRPGGLGLPILLYHLLNLIRRDKLKWTDEVAANQHAENESSHPNALGLRRLEKAPLLTLFKAAVINNAPDAIAALSGHIYEKAGGAKNRVVPELKKIAQGWGIPESAIKNITGRYYDSNPQFFTAEMLLIAAMQLLSYDLHNSLSQKSVSFRDKYITSDAVLDMPPISRSLTFSTGKALNTICMCEYGDETVFIAVCGAETPLQRDKLALEAVHRARVPLPPPGEDFIQTGKNAMTLCGDTYCGERYTKWRIARDIDDPMQRFGDAGYIYSFEKVAPLLSRDTFNIVNSECVLSPVYDKPQQTGKYIDFVLGANPEKTIACYKEAGVDAVMLANNHSMDFGPVGCRQTLGHFAGAGLNPIGMGSNIDEAERPLQLELGGRQVIVFNAYCYFLEKRHKTFRHYCLGANSGTAFGTDLLDDVSLWNRIRQYRAGFPDAYILFSPHWSSDFNSRHAHLRPIAENAFNAGADLIIGHGPHIPIGAERLGGKLCFYSVGNFVFNTTGVDLDASGQSPYGVVARIDFAAAAPLLRMYPIYAHNLKTFFQPYPVTEQWQFDEFASSIMGLDMFEIIKDDIGYYMNISL